MAKDYLVIVDCTEPYDEHTEWKVVPKCENPEDALSMSGFNPIGYRADDYIATVFALDSKNGQAQFIGERKGPRLSLNYSWVKKGN